MNFLSATHTGKAGVAPGGKELSLVWVQHPTSQFPEGWSVGHPLLAIFCLILII